VIAAAIAFCLVVITVLYLTLTSGLQIKKLKLGSVLVEQLYIKWDNTLSVSIGSLAVKEGSGSRPFDLQKLRNRFAGVLRHANGSWIGSLRIARFESNGTSGSLYFDPHGRSTFLLGDEHYSVACTMDPLPDGKAFLIEANATSTDFNATLKTQGLLRLADANLFLTGNINVSDSIFLSVGLHAADDAAYMNLYSTKWFESVAPLVVPMHLDSSISQWIVDRAQGGPLMLHTLRTTLPYDAPEKALDNLYAHLTFENARYAFANDPTEFEPAVAREVTVVFKDKKLHIVPVDSTFYGQSGGSTWLDIDFGKPQTVLDLYLHTKAMLTPPLQRLTKSYGIDLPFIQTGGATEAELTLNINLEKLSTEASGRFRIQEGTVDFSGLPIELNATDISLANSDITIRSLHAKLFDGNVTASVEGEFDPAEPKGLLHFSVPRARFGMGHGQEAIALAGKPFQFDYVIRPKKERLLCDASQWRFGDHNISLSAFDAPFDFGSLRISLPKTLMAVDKKTKAYLSGPVDLKTPSADLDIDLVALEIGSFHAAQPHTYIHLQADENLSVETNTTSYWTKNETPLTVGPITVTKRNGTLKLRPVQVSMAKQFAATVDGVFDPETLSTELNVTDFRFEDKTLEGLFESTERFSVYIVPIDNEFDIIVPSLNLLYSTKGDGWKIHFFSLEAFKERSPILSEYNLTQSSFTAWTEQGGYPILFSGAVDYPYALTIYKDKPVSVYRFKGAFDANDTVQLTVNDAIDVSIGKTIELRSDRIDYNLPEFTRFYMDHLHEGRQIEMNESNDTNNTNESNESKTVLIDANNTSIVISDGRKAKADRIALQYEGGILHAQLFKGRGGAMLEVNGADFYLYGKGLDDDFMENIFKFSKFKGGTLDFYVIGNKDNFNGLVKIDDTTLRDYVLLNNLFAFMNTVPALVTFSLPSYEVKGIKIDSAYAELNYHNEILTVSGINVKSKEMDFAGQGVIDYNTDKMQMQLTVKTRAGENLRKIPVVGYILVGDKSAFTTVDITGPLEDPKISSTIAKDIIVTPFNLLKRAFNFPVHYLEQFERASQKPEKSSDSKQVPSDTPPSK